MSTSVKQVLGEQEAYRTIWRDTYRPVRKVLAGSWLKQPGGLRFKLTFDVEGRFWFECLDLESSGAGGYTVISRDGVFYIALNFGDGTPWVLAVDEILENRIQLRTVGEPNVRLDFVRTPARASLA